MKLTSAVDYQLHLACTLDPCEESARAAGCTLIKDAWLVGLLVQDGGKSIARSIASVLKSCITQFSCVMGADVSEIEDRRRRGRV